MIDILLLSFSAILIENFVFVKFLGTCPFLGVSGKVDTAVCMGLAVIFVNTIASIVTWLFYTYVLVPFELEYLQTIAFILIIASLVQLIEMFMKKSLPPLYNSLGIYLPLITTNCAVLGVTILNIQNEFTFIESTVYGFSSAVGFMLALVVFSGVRQRLKLAKPPKAFKGVPIYLVAAGLIAMAFSGFQGVDLSSVTELTPFFLK